MEKPARSVLDWGTGTYERTAEQLLPAAEVLVDAAAIEPGERVLDLGCGTGNAALLAAARGARVTAVDPSERLLGVTREAATSQGLDVVTEIGEAARIPAPDAAVDCLLSSFALIFAPDPAAAAAEIARVLAAGGRAAFSAWVPGGAVGTCATAARALVLEALGTPSPAPGFSWHDEPAVSKLFTRYGMQVSVLGRHQIAGGDHQLHDPLGARPGVGAEDLGHGWWVQTSGEDPRPDARHEFLIRD